MNPWWSDFLTDRVSYLHNEDVATLIQRALHSHEGELSDQGALVVKTGTFTGRATEDKYVVQDKYSEDRIDWKNVKALSQRQFDNIKNEFVRDYNHKARTLYLMERSVCADQEFSLGLRLVTPQASHALFASHIFREKVSDPALGFYTIYHCPDLELEYEGLGIRSSTVIALNFTSQEILVGGTGYAGEIKKAVFSVLNTILPDHNVLPIHAGSNIDENNNTSVFFGLSGTGKTTLSTDIGKKIIGDDEHGLTSGRIFNFEGGCYAKTYKLNSESEPQLYSAINRFGSVMENVYLDDNHSPDFNNKTLTENGRATFPLKYLEEHHTPGVAPFPRNFFFLSADAMGVLPAISKLDHEQIIFYFLSGYTAKLAGTEIGLAGVKATFSHCFGAPFMMRHPSVYASLLSDIINKKAAKFWLINTGWYGGTYGIGSRYDLSLTRSLVRAVQRGDFDNTSFVREPFFGLNIPESAESIDSKWFNPSSLWKDLQEYEKTADYLKNLFQENFAKFENTYGHGVVDDKNEGLI